MSTYSTLAKRSTVITSPRLYSSSNLNSAKCFLGGVGQSTHGQDDRARKPGSIGACSYPAKVFKGMRMGGQMGGDRVTTQNLKVLKVISDKNLIIVKGSVAGCNGSTVLIKK